MLAQDRFLKIAARCGADVAPQTLRAIAEVESDLDPLAIHDSTTGRAFKPDSRAEAEMIAGQLIAAGHSVDVGIMQINSNNLQSFGLSLAHSFDTCSSIALGARILADGYAGGSDHAAQQKSLRRAISSYNTGNQTAGFVNGYVHRVEIAARQFVPAIDTGRTDGETEAKQTGSVAGQPTPWDVWDDLGSLPAESSPQMTSTTAEPLSQSMAVFPAESH